MDIQTTPNTCPECNYAVFENYCTNKYCNYRGAGWTQEQCRKAWALHGVDERTTGAQYDYTGRD